jgi:methionyl-tRNA formyltransferase
MRVLFAGSPAIAVPSLEALSREDGIELAGVLTSPDNPRRRNGRPQSSETGEAASAILKEYETKGRPSFPILKPLKLDSAIREEVKELKPDLLVSFAYGHFFGPKFMGLFPLGGINIHPSLLPKYRGPAPIQAAILNRDGFTGISIQKLSQEMDGGDILVSEQFELTGEETAGSLGEIMAEKAARMLPGVLKKIADGTARATAQDKDKITYCSLISTEDAVIDWKMSAGKIEARVRAFDPWPLCRTVHKGRDLLILKASVHKGKNGGALEKPGLEKLRLEKPGLVLGIDKQDGILVQTGEGILALAKLQYQAKKALFWRDFLNGARDFSGSVLG